MIPTIMEGRPRSVVSVVATSGVVAVIGGSCFTSISGHVAPVRPSVTTSSVGDHLHQTQQPRDVMSLGQGCTVLASTAAVSLAAVARQRQRRSVAKRAETVVRAAALDYGEELSVPADAFITLGPHCFEQGAGSKKLQDVWVLEPVTASTVEVVYNGAQTSFEAMIGTTVGKLLAKDISVFPKELLCGHGEVRWGDSLEFRTGCAARTWMRDHARDVIRKLVPPNELKTGFNTSTEAKRILNFVHVVNDSDNIKQDMSIDVYGREDDDKAAEEESKIAEMYNI